MEIYYININNFDYHFFYNQINNLEKHKIDKYLFYNDKRRSLASIILQKFIISKYYNLKFHEITISKNEYNKPYFKNNDNFNYNVSHDKDLVVIIGCFNLVGIDIMKIDNNLDINHFKSFFNEDIWKIIVDSNEKTIFYKYWCIIESYFKCIGTGITSPENIIIKYNENTVYENKLVKFTFNIIHFQDYLICVTLPFNNNLSNEYKIIEY